MILFTEAGNIAVKAIEDMHYIFVTGQQLGEPIAWGGPIVMNTREELELAFKELDEGTFIVETPIPKANNLKGHYRRSGIGKLNNPAKRRV